MSKMKDDAVLTTDEAIRYLKVSKPTLFKHIRHGKIKAVKVGREWRYLQTELYRFLKKGE
ncbi:MAG: helix-turn-helix domain-containing protein [Thermodesulfobacteriota bacterium]